jgi:hypothetical protein
MIAFITAAAPRGHCRARQATPSPADTMAQLPSRHGVFDTVRAAGRLCAVMSSAHTARMHHLAEIIDTIFAELMALIDRALRRVPNRTPPSSSA